MNYYPSYIRFLLAYFRSYTQRYLDVKVRNDVTCMV